MRSAPVLASSQYFTFTGLVSRISRFPGTWGKLGQINEQEHYYPCFLHYLKALHCFIFIDYNPNCQCQAKALLEFLWICFPSKCQSSYDFILGAVNV